MKITSREPTEVEQLKKWLTLLASAVFIFSYSLNALADEGHSDEHDVLNATEKFRNGGSMENEENETHEDMEGMNHDDMEGMDHGDSNTHNESGSHDDGG